MNTQRIARLGLALGLVCAAAAHPGAASAARTCRALTLTAKGHARVCVRFKLPASATEAKALRLAGRFGPRLTTHRFGRIPSLTLVGARVQAAESTLANPRAARARAASAGGSATQKTSVGGHEMTMKLNGYADDASWFDNGADGTGTLSVKTKQGTVKLGITVDQRTRTAKCPTADGEVKGQGKWIAGGDLGLDLPGAGSGAAERKVQLQAEAVGHVGDDGRLKTYDLTLKGLWFVNGHGTLGGVEFGDFNDVSFVGQLNGIDPHKPVTSNSVHLGNGKLSSFGLPYQVAAKDYPDWTSLFEAVTYLVVEQLNQSYLKSEHNFYDDAACLKLKVTPPGSPVAQGQTIALQAAVTAVAGGGEVAQKITATPDGLTIAPTQARSGAGSPARFTITTGSDASESVSFEGVSKRGRSLDTEHWTVLGQVKFTANRAGDSDDYDADAALSQPLLLSAEFTNLTFTATIPLTSVAPVGTDGSFVATGSGPFELAPGTEVDETTDYLDYPGTGCATSLTSWTPGTLRVTVTGTENPATGQLSYTVSYVVAQDIMGTYTDCAGTVDEPTSVLVGIYPWVVGQPAVYSDKFTPFGTQGAVQRVETETVSESTPSEQGSETDTTVTQILG